MSLSNQDNPEHPKTPRQLWIAIFLSIALAAALVYFGFLALPSLAAEHQAFWSGLIGSFVGSAVAFGGAAGLWRLERHILIEERKTDREEVRLQEQQRGDSRTLRDCLAVVGNLQALNYNMLSEARFATSRDKYLMRIRFDEAVSLIQDKVLRNELGFMSRLVEDADALDYMVMPEHSRLKTVHEWLLRLIALDNHEKLEEARPRNYEKLALSLKGHDEYMDEQMDLIAQYEHDKKQQAAQEMQQESEQGA